MRVSNRIIPGPPRKGASESRTEAYSALRIHINNDNNNNNMNNNKNNNKNNNNNNINDNISSSINNNSSDNNSIIRVLRIDSRQNSLINMAS